MAIDLPPDDGAPAAAREALEPLRAELDAQALGDVRLLVSELVTNSVRHAQLQPDDRVRLRVALRAGGRSASRSSTRASASRCGGRSSDGDLAGGLGLYLTEQLADRWGVDRVDDGTRVWFERTTEG